MKKRILLVEDDASLARVLRDNLGFDGYEVAWAADAREAVDGARAFAPDLVLLDLMLPGADGFDLFGLLRRDGPTPIIVLTARGQKADKLKGLQLGADDYVTKPFDIDELLARVRAVLRRTSRGAARLVFGDVVVDFETRTATRGERDLQLTHREFEVLQLLSERRPHVVHRNELLREVWGFPETPFTRAVDNAIARLRKKVEPDPARPRYIQTVHGDGYALFV